MAAAELDVILKKHHKNYVVVCGLQCNEPLSHALTQTFGCRHPVIMITRHFDAILSLIPLDIQSECHPFLQQTQDILRSLSHFEIFDLPEKEAPEPLSARLERDRHPTEVTSDPFEPGQWKQRDFTHFLTSRRRLPKATVQSDHELYPLSFEQREYSTLLSLSVLDVLKKDSPLKITDCACDAVELVIDAHQLRKDDIAQSLQTIRRHCSRPIVYHVFWQPKDGPTDEERYMDLVRCGLRLLPDYITIDLHCGGAQLTELSGAASGIGTIAHRRFGAHEECPWIDSLDVARCVERANTLRFVALRLVRETLSTLEDKDCVQFQGAVSKTSAVPVSATNVGIYAGSALVSNPSMTPVAQPSQSPINPRDLPLAHHALMKARFSSLVYQPLRFYLFGSDSDSGLCSAMHNSAFEFLGMSHNYMTRQTDEIGDLQSLVDDACGGFSVSLPFKSKVRPLLATLSGPARAIQAVDTIIPKRHGSNRASRNALDKHH